jgi:3-hydroxybutyryl-CoA dehydrogenase
MRITIIGNREQFECLESIINMENNVFLHVENIFTTNAPSDLVFDFLYDNSNERIEKLNSLQSVTFVNCVHTILENKSASFIRFNGWHNFKKGSKLELAVTDKSKQEFKSILNTLGLDYIIVPNIVGLITPRVISMLINEAFFALGEHVSTKEEIDIAMQLGTNYPYGPFEWSQKIGLQNIYTLLLLLSANDNRYTIANEMKKEVQKL